MKRFEYRYLRTELPIAEETSEVGDPILLKWCDEQGAEGWELFNLNLICLGKILHVSTLAKREVAP